MWDIRAVNEQQHICFPGNWPQGGNQGGDFNADFLSCSASLPTCSALRGPPRWTHASSILVKLKTSPEKKPQRERKSTTQRGKTRRSRWEGVFYKYLPLYFSTFYHTFSMLKMRISEVTDFKNTTKTVPRIPRYPAVSFPHTNLSITITSILSLCFFCYR